jgi:hypothetical protein
MTSGGLQGPNGWRGACLALAALALFVKIIVPPGFMVAAPQTTGGVALVICTGHGPLDAGAGHDKGGLTKSRSDAPCAFAGHAAPPTPALGVAVPASTFTVYARPAGDIADLIPGRGLAAPPPPSQAPPLTL